MIYTHLKNKNLQEKIKIHFFLTNTKKVNVSFTKKKQQNIDIHKNEYLFIHEIRW
jgi:hypothetical protein